MRGVGRGRIILALAAVYVVWGSTYLAIRIGVETLPPFGLAAARFLLAGALLYGWLRLRGAARPTAAHWKSAAIAGAALLLCGNGVVTWAEQWVASGLAALLISTVPLFIVLFEWGQSRVRPSAAVFAGLLVGFAGVAILIGPSELGGGALLPSLAIVAASMSWAGGSLYARAAPSPAEPLLGTAMQMLCGGLALALLSAATGELARFEPARAGAASLGALAYLVFFGSLVGFTAYAWLIRNVPASLASTYAYVNPVVAVLLGWLVASEPIGPNTLLASALVVSSVALITAFKARKAAPSPAVEAPAPTPAHMAEPPAAVARAGADA